MLYYEVWNDVWQSSELHLTLVTAKLQISCRCTLKCFLCIFLKYVLYKKAIWLVFMNLILHPPQDLNSPYLSFLYTNLHMHMSYYYFQIKILCFLLSTFKDSEKNQLEFRMINWVVKWVMCLAMKLCMLMGYSTLSAALWNVLCLRRACPWGVPRLLWGVGFVLGCFFAKYKTETIGFMSSWN